MNNQLKVYKEELFMEIVEMGKTLEQTMELHDLVLANRVSTRIELLWEKWHTVCECIKRCDNE